MTALTLEDHREIYDLFVRYAWAIDEGDTMKELAEIFTDDVVLEGPISGRHEGAEALRTWTQVADGRPVSQARHFITNFLIRGESDTTASVDAYFLHFQTNEEPRLPHRGPVTDFCFAGRYECTVRRVDGVWRIAKRKAVIDSRS